MPQAICRFGRWPERPSARGCSAVMAIRAMQVLVALALTLLTVAAHGTSYQEARAAYDRSEFTLAQSLWQTLAEAGDVEAMFALGALLYEGPGEVPVNYLESSRWYATAAELGHADAQYNLGNAYQRGLGVWQDDLQAAQWWQKAAEQGLPKAAYNLGVQYAYGRGVPQSREQALYWFSQAADKGHLQARQLIAELGAPDQATTTASKPPRPDAVRPAPVIAADRTAVPETSDSRIEQADSVNPPSVSAGMSPTEQMFDAGERRLLAAEPAAFTLQLTAMSSAQRLQEYIRIHGLEGDLIRFRFRAADRTLYGLSLGIYPNREDGEDVRQAVHRQHAQQTGWQAPWLRPTDDLKALIRLMSESLTPHNR